MNIVICVSIHTTQNIRQIVFYEHFVKDVVEFMDISTYP